MEKQKIDNLVVAREGAIALLVARYSDEDTEQYVKGVAQSILNCLQKAETPAMENKKVLNETIDEFGHVAWKETKLDDWVCPMCQNPHKAGEKVIIYSGFDQDFAYCEDCAKVEQ